MKSNLILLIKIIIFEIVYFFSILFFFIFLLFGYFGSGAGATSPAALTCGIIANYILIAPPLLFNIYKIFKLYKNQFAKSMMYLIAEIILIPFFVYEYLTGLT